MVWMRAYGQDIVNDLWPAVRQIDGWKGSPRQRHAPCGALKPSTSAYSSETLADPSTYHFRCEIGPATATVVPLPEGNNSYRAMLKLHEVLHDVLFSFYRTSEKDKAAIEPMANYFDGSSGLTVYAIDRKLDDWADALPHGLRLDDRATKDSMQHRQAVILRQRSSPSYQCILSSNG